MFTIVRESQDMGKVFNITGACNPKLHYMVDISNRLEEIKKLVDKGAYFTINRARQFGKTTTLTALQQYLKDEYVVIFLDFQFLSNANFESEKSFSMAFADEIGFVDGVPENTQKELSEFAEDKSIAPNLRNLFKILSRWCAQSDKPIVLIIDEIDSASNNQVFMDFLAQLRGYYLHRESKAIFQSVILSGVHDVKNIKRKIRPDDESKVNSPWNIAIDFKVDMSFSKDDIEKMLEEYKSYNNTDMDTDNIAGLIYDYTSGYPFLVSRICQLLDEEINPSYAWTEQGVLEAVKIILQEKNTLFDSIMGKLSAYPELEKTIYTILFSGEKMVYNTDNEYIDIATMYGFIKNNNGSIEVANRIFESRLYNYFLSTSEAQNSKIFRTASNNKNQFINNNHLDMDLVMKKFVEYFDEIYGDNVENFDEDEGRRRFLLYLRPIINGTGNYYIEAETRNSRRMDVVVDYSGERFIIELKIWRGNAYNERGEEQLADYLDYFKLKKGYMLSYNFNKTKEIGIKELKVGDRLIVEAIV
jgi:hypothetical protein